MVPSTLQLAWFSPTGTTRKVLRAVAEGLEPSRRIETDLTLPEPAPRQAPADPDLLLLGAPVYAGRVAPLAASRLARLEGKGTPAALVVLFGNRAYEDALLELMDLAENLGFRPFAAAAFIGEHSFSTPGRPIASGRPDASDLGKAADFGRRIREKLAAVPEPAALNPPQVPGHRPYREVPHRPGIGPITDETLCTRGGNCAAACPAGAVTLSGPIGTDPLAGTLCCACVKGCPTGARQLKDERVLKITDWLIRDHSLRREPEVFIR